MKKLLFAIALACFMPFTSVYGEFIDLSVGYVDETPIIAIPTKSPIRPERINLENHQIEFAAMHPDYTLVLLDEDGVVVWQTVVPAATSTVVLPATLTGDFELRLYPDGTAYFFYGWIEL
jgi:hypothetical protein